MTMFAPGLFEDRVAVVTGGGTGIGLQTITRLAKLGAHIAICGRRTEPLEAAAEAMDRLGAQCLWRSCDIREPEQVAAFADAIKEKFGRVDILINNAGGQFPTTAETLSPNGWMAVIRNNLNGTFFMTREIGTRLMIPNRSGRILSIIACIETGFPGMIHTGAARAGVENMTKTLAIEWAMHGITAVSLAPGLVLSSGTKQYPRELLEISRLATPVKRWASEEETADIIVFLASPSASFITGCTVKADGGASIWGERWQIPDHENS
jgi:citronellol/citronellal dehydrogenase